MPPQYDICLSRTRHLPLMPYSRRTSPLAVTARLTARLTWACFVDGQLAALHFDILEPCNGGLGLTGIGHLHKPEAAWPARLTVGDEIDTPHSTIGFEELPYILWICGKRNIADKNLHTSSLPKRGTHVPTRRPNTAEVAGNSLGASRRLPPPPGVRREARSQRMATQADWPSLALKSVRRNNNST